MTRKYTTLPFTEYPVAAGHYDTTRLPITKIVLHSSASTRQGIINTFGGGTRMVSAHYGIDNDGSILAFLEEYNTAYHSGNYAVNQCSIGIEHIDNGSEVKLHTDQQYKTSIDLVADLCKFYNISADLAHIVPHSSIVATACPNGLDVNRIIKGVQELLNPQSTPCVITDQTKIPQLDGQEVQAIVSQIKAKDSEITSLKLSLTALNSTVNDLQYKLDHLPPNSSQALYIAIHDILWGKDYFWVKLSKMKALFPK